MLPGYLDYNATAPMRPQVRAAMMEATEVVGNPSSVHRFGRTCRRMLETAREDVAGLIGCTPGDVVFTSGGTEANCLALMGLPGGDRLVSAIEHESVLAAAEGADRIPVTSSGLVDLSWLERRLAADLTAPALVSIMLVNNETGVIQPVAEAAALARRAGALVHCDAVQAAGRIDIDMMALGVDLLSLSSHKLGGPQGVGCLVVRPTLPLRPMMVGGGQELRRRAGTENLAGVVGFGVAAQLAAAERNLASAVRLGDLRDRLEQGVQALTPLVQVVGAHAPRVANTSCFALPGLSSETQIMALDLAGIGVSAGAACSSGKVTPSHVLTAMGYDATSAKSAIRVSLGWASTDDDVLRFLDAWSALIRRTMPTTVAA